MENYEIIKEKRRIRATAPVNNEIGFLVPFVSYDWFRWPGCIDSGRWEFGVTVENEHGKNAYVFRDGEWHPVVGLTYGPPKKVSLLMTDKRRIKEIVDYMVEHGTESTHYGNWIFGVEDDLVAFSGMSQDWLMQHYDDICYSLIVREEVAEVDREANSKGVHLLSIYFYTSFCPNLYEEEE